MAMTRSMTRSRSYAEDDKHVVAPWSDVNHDLLLLVMMRLGVVDFIAFSGVCKSWRSFALCNRKMFMASKQPMSLSISSNFNEKECCLEDFEGRKFKTPLPSFSAGREYARLTCGYLVFFGTETKDFWLVNPITRHQLHFPNLPDDPDSTYNLCESVKVILVFSPSISGRLLVMAKRYGNKIWFSIAGKGVWNHVSTTSYILDVHAFKGKIYTLNIDYGRGQRVRHLCEMRFSPEPTSMVLETKNFPNLGYIPHFVSYGENLYVVDYRNSTNWYNVYKLDLDEMKWVDHEKTKEEFAFYKNHKGYMTGTYKGGNCRFNTTHLWYFPHDCLNVNQIDG